jgi:hypothetical protein
MSFSQEERVALDALRAAVWALERADQRCVAAEYGSEIMASLDDARKAVAYALAVAEGRR